ncbi:MAG: hypothetical protein K9L31_03295, partial [Candidatus Pacebacteria bacterium]|nr:hypothetical protein [Candidatus Paceibacterota bacterium]
MEENQEKKEDVLISIWDHFKKEEGVILSLFALMIVFMMGNKLIDIYAADPVPELVKVINPQPRGGGGSDFIEVGGITYFVGGNETYGEELWRTDGTANGTVMVKDIRVGYRSSQVSNLTDVNGVLFFTADDGINGSELWKSDGTEVGTVMLSNRLDSNSFNFSSAVVNGVLYFSTDDTSTGDELWRSDGTVDGTHILKDINPGVAGSAANFPFVINNTLYFFVNTDGTNYNALYTSDGTEIGTTIVVSDIGVGSYDKIVINNILYYKGYYSGFGTELWKTDGTASGTEMVKDISIGNSGSLDSNIGRLIDVNGTLFFTADDGINGLELWKSDGTASGTEMIVDLTPGAGFSYIQNGVVLGDSLYFAFDDAINGYELWKSDGTASGTVIVKDINPGVAGSIVENPLVLNGVLYFIANDGINGNELWKSDGTEGGTIMVQDINIGDTGCSGCFYQAGNYLYYPFNDGVHGIETWRTDGTSNG